MRAFTLVELLVTVAIVLLLAAIGVPAYKEHMMKTKVTTAVNYMDNISVDFTRSFNDNAVFPTIGATAGTGFLSPYVHSYTGDADGATTCNAGYIQANIGGYNSGDDYFVSNPNGNGIVYYRYFVEVNKAIQSFCAYYEIVDNVQGADPGYLRDCEYTNAEPAAYTAALATNGC